MNGATISPIGDWVIAICQGKDLIGQPHYAGRPLRVAGMKAGDPGRIVSLSPVFELQIKIEVMQVMDARTRQPARDPQGNPMLQQRAQYSAVPVLLLASLASIDLPDGAILIDVASLSPEDRKRMASCVAQAEGMQANMRAAETNLTLVSSLPAGMPKPPGLP
jgi:hypothetical protein